MPGSRTRREALRGAARSPGDPSVSHCWRRCCFPRADRCGTRADQGEPGRTAGRCRGAAAGGTDFSRDVGLRRRPETYRPRHRAGAAARDVCRKGADAGSGHIAPQAREGLARDLKDHSTASGGRGPARAARPRKTAITRKRCRPLQRAAAGDAPASVWFDLGLARQDLRDHAGSTAAYRKAIEIKPDHADATLNLGVVLQETATSTARCAPMRRLTGCVPPASAPSRWR